MESVHRRVGASRRRAPGTYLVAAALVEDHDLEEGRTALEALLRPGQKKIHWHDEGARRRTELVQAVSDLDMVHAIVVRDAGDAIEPSERRRRKCLEHLLWMLDNAHGVAWATLEARQEKQNQSDRHLHDTMRAQKSVTALRMDHVPGPTEPLLWVADIVAGAFVAHRCGDQVGYDSLASLVEVREIRP